jgi:hypothetical protein
VWPGAKRNGESVHLPRVALPVGGSSSRSRIVPEGFSGKGGHEVDRAGDLVPGDALAAKVISSAPVTAVPGLFTTMAL